MSTTTASLLVARLDRLGPDFVSEDLRRQLLAQEESQRFADRFVQHHQGLESELAMTVAAGALYNALAVAESLTAAERLAPHVTVPVMDPAITGGAIAQLHGRLRALVGAMTLPPLQVELAFEAYKAGGLAEPPHESPAEYGLRGEPQKMADRVAEFAGWVKTWSDDSSRIDVLNALESGKGYLELGHALLEEVQELARDINQANARRAVSTGERFSRT
jgi:hypothetical protein